MEGKEHIVGRAVLEGKLELISPLVIGGGRENREEEAEKDDYVLKNREGVPLIPGTSLIGVLRETLSRRNPALTSLLFGDAQEMQSAVCAYDVVYPQAKLTYRDGVQLDPYRKTAAPSKKYEYEVVERGASAAFRMVITLRGCHTKESAHWKEAEISDETLDGLLFLKDELQKGIALGAMTAKGFGRVRAVDVSLGLYDFKCAEDVRNWLAQELPTAQKASRQLTEKSALFSANPRDFSVRAEFALRSSLLVRDYTVNTEGKSVAVMLKSGEDAVIPGTTLKGALRHRAMYIAEKLGKDRAWLEDLMGRGEEEEGLFVKRGRSKSRLVAEESYLDLKQPQLREMEVTRNRIDRFTGGVMRGALFTTKPIWQEDETQASFVLRFMIRDASEAEAGLALFLLKDLWLGDLPIGAETGVGRGSIRGLQADICYDGKTFQIKGDGCVQGDLAVLNRYAEAFCGKEV